VWGREFGIMDALYLGLTALLFALSVGLIRLCKRV